MLGSGQGRLGAQEASGTHASNHLLRDPLIIGSPGPAFCHQKYVLQRKYVAITAHLLGQIICLALLRIQPVRHSPRAGAAVLGGITR